MAQKKEFLLDGFAVEIVKHSKAKNIRIRLQPHKPVRVTIPLRAAFSLGEHFLKQRLPWIKENLPALEAKTPQKLFDWDYVLSTIYGKIRLIPKGTEVENGIIGLELPVDYIFDDSENQTEIEKLLIEKLRSLAKKYLPQRLQELADKTGFQYEKVTVKNLKTRWGSCSSVNNINLNMQLMRLPKELIDYVLMHELQHTTIKNHSANFWRTLETNWPGAKQLDKVLNQYRISWF
jgi:predicted metal-dependent hydrolase